MRKCGVEFLQLHICNFFRLDFCNRFVCPQVQTKIAYAHAPLFRQGKKQRKKPEMQKRRETRTKRKDEKAEMKKIQCQRREGDFVSTAGIGRSLPESSAESNSVVTEHVKRPDVSLSALPTTMKRKEKRITNVNNIFLHKSLLRMIFPPHKRSSVKVNIGSRFAVSLLYFSLS